MSELEENWQKENLEKSKEVLKDHFKRKKRERERELDVPRYTMNNLHSGNSWTIDESDFDDLTTPIERKSFFNKIKNFIVKIRGSE